MVQYKGLEVSSEIPVLLPHMPQIEEYREILQSLQAVWDNLNLLGQLSGITAEMGATRVSFSTLTSNLLHHLAERTLARRVQDMTAKAQVVIDMLVRNLFERTADIGFPATDEEIRRFLQAELNPEMLRQRLLQYVAKYSVYDEVFILDLAGNVLLCLASDSVLPPSPRHEAWFQLALQSHSNYVEFYGVSCLSNQKEPSLFYATKVNLAKQGGAGVLVLSFRFADEMARIFADLYQADNPAVMALLTADGCVLASSDPWQIPLGAPLRLRDLGKWQLLRFAGRSYLAIAHSSKGYQGYWGPGWLGAIFVPLEQAFHGVIAEPDTLTTPDYLAAIMAGGRAFPASLQAIPLKADAIQRDLNRSVWNGSIRHSHQQLQGTFTTNHAFSKLLLWEISHTAVKMRQIFSNAIHDLNATVLAALQEDCCFFAGLAVDLLDRNLYERANDCRWWALAPPLAHGLSQAPTSSTQHNMCRLLTHLHSLYTVYASLLLFNQQGEIVAVSRTEQEKYLGQTIDDTWVGDCLQLTSSQAYFVSSFTPTPLYDNRPSYIYTAAVRSPVNDKVLGGIALIFDSEPQFAAMLQEVLPRDTVGSPIAGTFAAFVDIQGKVIACSGKELTIGQCLDLPEQLLSPPPEGFAKILLFAGQVMVIGAKSSHGYREYQRDPSNGQTRITALVFLPLADYRSDIALTKPAKEINIRQKSSSETLIERCEIASFFVGDYWLGLPIVAIEEAFQLSQYSRLPNAAPQVLGVTVYQGKAILLYDLHSALGLSPPTEVEMSTKEIIVVRDNRDGKNRCFGFPVDALGEIPEIATSAITSSEAIYLNISPVLGGMVKVSSQLPMLALLNTNYISEQVFVG